jgi:hypothetical protein
MSLLKKTLMLGACLAAFSPLQALACACGCGVFDVGTGTMMPTAEGGEAWLEYDFMNQTQNWHGTSSAPKPNNEDKILRSDFIVAGAQYMFDRDWGLQTQIPFTNRMFKTTTDNPNPGDTQVFHHAAIGNIHLSAIYSGFSDDMSTGVTFGLKLPTGDYAYHHFDRDSSIGSGSTDLLLGAYHQGALLDDTPFNWFANGQWDHAFVDEENYRPGDEFDAAVGSYYDGFAFDNGTKVAPLLQLIGSVREHDIGLNADPANSGYQRLLVSPGVEYDINQISLYGDVEVPVFQNVNGNQIVAPVLTKVMVGYKF